MLTKVDSVSEEELRDEQFVLENKEAMLAVSLFGKECNIGSAKISLEVINQDKWQDKRKRKRKIEEFKKQGIVLEEENKEIGFRETLASLTNSEDEIVFMPSENTNQVEKNINQRDETIK